MTLGCLPDVRWFCPPVHGVFGRLFGALPCKRIHCTAWRGLSALCGGLADPSALGVKALPSAYPHRPNSIRFCCVLRSTRTVRHSESVSWGARVPDHVLHAVPPAGRCVGSSAPGVSLQ